MSKKDYTAIAAILAEAEEAELGAAPWTVGMIADAIADVFASDSPRFDRERFLAAARGVNR